MARTPASDRQSGSTARGSIRRSRRWRGEAGATVRRGARVSAVDPATTARSAILHLGEERLRARLVIGADGRAFDRRAIGRGRPSDPPPAEDRPDLARRRSPSSSGDRLVTPDARMVVRSRRLRRPRAGARRPASTSASCLARAGTRRLLGTARGNAPVGSSPWSAPTDDDPTAWAACRAVRPDRRRRAARRPRDAPRRPGLAPGRRCGRVPRPVHRRGPASGARLGRAGGRGHRTRARGRGRPAALAGLRPRDAPPVRVEGRRVVARPVVPRAARAVRVRGAAARRPRRASVRRWAS